MQEGEESIVRSWDWELKTYGYTQSMVFVGDTTHGEPVISYSNSD